MRRLVGVQRMGMLITRARMIDLVKIHTVIIGGLFRHSILLIDQERSIRSAAFQRALGLCAHRLDDTAFPVYGRNLPQRGTRALKRHPHITPGERQHAAGHAGNLPIRIIGRCAHSQPFEALTPVEKRVRLFRISHAVIRRGNGESGVRDAAVIIKVEVLIVLSQVNHHRFALRGGSIARLRRACGAQIPKTHDGIHLSLIHILSRLCSPLYSYTTRARRHFPRIPAWRFRTGNLSKHGF